MNRQDYDPTDLRGIERDKAETEAVKRTARRTEIEDLKWLMGIKRGRAIVWRWMSDAGVFRSSFNTNSMTMAFNEGNRNCGNKLLSEVMSLTPEMFLKMQQEANDGRNDDGNADHSN